MLLDKIKIANIYLPAGRLVALLYQDNRKILQRQNLETACNKGLASTLADGIKSAVVRYSSVVPGVTFIVRLLYLSSATGSLLGATFGRKEH